MLNIRKLKEICEYLEKEYGSDTSVIIQFYNENDQLISGDYALSYVWNEAGTLYLTNKFIKEQKQMKRLVGDKKESNDEWLGKPIEIINTDSKLYAFRGIVDKLKNDKYTLTLYPEAYENTDKHHHLYINKDQMFKWVRLLPKEFE